MTLLLILLVEALIIVVLLIWVTLLTLRATGRIGHRRGSWSASRAPQKFGERHLLNR